MAEILKKNPYSKLISLRVEPELGARLAQIRATTNIDVAATMREWLREMAAELELEAKKEKPA